MGRVSFRGQGTFAPCLSVNMDKSNLLRKSPPILSLLGIHTVQNASRDCTCMYSFKLQLSTSIHVMCSLIA